MSLPGTVEPRARTRSEWTAALLFGALVGLVALPLFSVQAQPGRSDFAAHVEFARAWARHGAPVTERFGFELLILLAAGFSRRAAALTQAAAAVAAAATAAKAALSARLAGRELPPVLALGAATAALLAAPITLEWRHALHPRASPVHLGQMSGLIFHNPTTVVVFPLALALFACSWRERRTAAAVLAAVQCSIKPSYVVAWLPAYVALELVRHGARGRALARLAATVAPAIAVLGWQYLTTTKLGGGMVVAPWRAWGELSADIPMSIARSLAFPAAFVLVHFRELRGRGDHGFAWGVFAVAFAQYALLYITGPVYGGNWSWGRYLAIYVVFLLSLVRFADLARRPGSWRGAPGAANTALLALVALHVAAGARYAWEGWRLGRW